MLQSRFLAQKLKLRSVTFHFNPCMPSDPNQCSGSQFEMRSADIAVTLVPTEVDISMLWSWR